MKVLLIGSGGREHAIAWKVAQSPRLTRLYIAPGNPGAAECGENVPLDVTNQVQVVTFCKEKGIDLVIVGPEVPLADGLADSLIEGGIRCFGPKQAAAQIESSKVFSKNFMARHHIPTANYATFNDIEDAIEHLEQVDHPIVIKASGLAAGKGVILPDTAHQAKATLESIMIQRAFGASGSEVVIEERLNGQEVSLMAFSDGETIVPMLPAQDHKRLLDDDKGPNTGGMGAYAPAPAFTPDLMDEAIERILKPAILGLKLEGTPFIGVLYAGLILTSNGLSVIEFNSRFGDPEAQVVLPLLETDLLTIVEACVNGTLKDLNIRWKEGAAACVVIAGKGYPEKAESGKPITFETLPPNIYCFHAGTKLESDRIVTAGGRVLGLTAWGDDIILAVKEVYKNINKIHFDGMQYRKDIAHHALKRSAYSEAGVSIDAGNRATMLMKDAVKSTYTPAVLSGIGSFGGLFDASALKGMKSPVLVASTDGVGTKVKLTASVGRFRGIGHDIVNHCINDILVQGARPLFFMDYFATSKLNPEQTAEVVTGIAEACKEAGMALLGGETAEMPGVYQPGEFDVAGTIVGVIERDEILPRPSIKAGDVLIGLTSNGPHTNGYSLIRKVFADVSLNTFSPELDCYLADALLVPHRSYLSILYPILSHIKGLAHITGGGFIENIPRVIPDGLSVEIQLGSWPVPPLWNLIRGKGKIDPHEMYRVFNMGIGMIAIVDKGSAGEIQKLIPEETYLIGKLSKGNKEVKFVN
jgi:phosphoribosylamine--glycine ligase/phosphoribosylformylglycinamidine cyclo-ligase